MSSRYRDRDYDRDEDDYGRRREGERSQGRSGLRDESDRYEGESRWRGQYGSSSSSGRGRDYDREDYGSSGSESNRGWEVNRDLGDRDRSYGAYGQHYYGGQGSSTGQNWGSGEGSSTGQNWGKGQGYSTGQNWGSGRSYGTGQGYGQSYGRGQRYSGGQDDRFDESSSSYSRRYDYPSDSPSRGMYGSQGGRSSFDYDRSRYGRGQERGYEYERDRSGSGGDRGWWDRASDEVASWFGDEEAERRRRMDEQRDQVRGRGPKGYRRSDERIKEDVNDRLSEGYLDASDVEVSVSNAEVTLTGTVNSRRDKRQAEDIAESVSGVTNVENRLRVKQQSGSQAYSNTGTTAGYSSSTGTTGAEATASTSPTSTSSAAAGAGTGSTTGTTGTTGSSRTKS